MFNKTSFVGASFNVWALFRLFLSLASCCMHYLIVWTTMLTYSDILGILYMSMNGMKWHFFVANNHSPKIFPKVALHASKKTLTPAHSKLVSDLTLPQQQSQHGLVQCVGTLLLHTAYFVLWIQPIKEAWTWNVWTNQNNDYVPKLQSSCRSKQLNQN